MPGLYATPIPPEGETVRMDVREVVKELFEKPHLLIRISIAGPYFPQRSAEPYMRVGEVRSNFVEISPDGLRADGYFDRPLPKRGEVVFGYGHDVDLIVPTHFRAEAIQRLDPEKLRRAAPDLLRPSEENGPA